MKQPKLSDSKVDVVATKRLRASIAKAKKIKITVNVVVLKKKLSG